MNRQDVIKQVMEPTPWISNLTAVEKNDNLLRVCLDPQSLNKAIQIPKYAIPKTDDILVKLGFGINCTPEMFMAEMMQIFGEIKNVSPYFDDLIIATETDREHDVALSQVCQQARKYNVKFNPDKLQFKKPSVQFLGPVISAQGMKPAYKHIRALVELPIPTDKSAVLRFFGFVKFLARFLPNVSQLTANLRQLTRKDVKFQWTAAHQDEFHHIKKLIISEPTLTFFDSKKPVVIQTDSSKDVLVHSDHRPLESILKKDLDKVSVCLQRLRLRLPKYNVMVQYMPGMQLLVADAFSRAYLIDEIPNLEYQTITVHFFKLLAVSAQKAEWIAAETKADSDLAQIMAWTEKDQWPSLPSSQSPGLARYLSLCPFLSAVDGMLFFEYCLVVPSSVRLFFLAKLHEGHLVVEKTKQLARETVYWPGMTVDISNFVKVCSLCQKFARNNVKQPLQSYPIASYQWQHLAADIATIDKEDFLVVVDKFSNWPEDQNTPVADTGFFPAQILLGRCFQKKLQVASQLLNPQCVPHVVIVANKEKSQAVQQY
ncbi:hypothetical protein V9T40_007020 [Parthenolecanium corni]|uniref:RNA-directed DNA polymerase n=1 Tax=Parthenolecanium corni TaxID=536013 RepID=A0AAN9YBH0_9HEMI